MTNNDRQREYYESRFAAKGEGNEAAANWITNQWTAVRRRIQAVDRSVGIKERVLERHREWLGDLSSKEVLDLGCFSGNDLSLHLARNARAYTGIDLSESAIGQLNEYLEDIPTAEGVAGDFLSAGFSDARFDAVYAHSVLHHFSDFERLCAELQRVLKPGGIVVALDPTQTEPLNWLARVAYRPFQSDRDWEWPFRRRNFELLNRYFEIDAIQGYRGFSKLGYLIPRLGRWGLEMDEKYANKQGFWLYVCWLVTICLRRRDGEEQDADG